MKPQPVNDRQMIRKQILEKIGKPKDAYPPSELREQLIRAEYSPTQFFNFHKKEEIL